jgi:hypothetical protein
LNANCPHCVKIGLHVEIADVPPDALCAEEITIGADALIIFADVGIGGAAGGVLPAINHTSILADPVAFPVIVQLFIVQLYGTSIYRIIGAVGVVAPPSKVAPNITSEVILVP